MEKFYRRHDQLYSGVQVGKWMDEKQKEIEDLRKGIEYVANALESTAIDQKKDGYVDLAEYNTALARRLRITLAGHDTGSAQVVESIPGAKQQQSGKVLAVQPVPIVGWQLAVVERAAGAEEVPRA